MPNEMVERIKLALSKEVADWHDEFVENVIRVVLKEMRIPTKRMLENAGTMSGYECEGLPFSEGPDSDHIEWWECMVDEALAE